MTFEQLALSAPLLEALRKMKFSSPTPIQAKAIPIGIEGKDLIACAETGSGKTAAYAIPLIHQLLIRTDAAALILAPTRELASQISTVLRSLTLTTPNLRLISIVGGADMRKQLQQLKAKPRIIVATPGRLTDHLRRGSLKLDKVGFLVLDEGDRMLDMGFAPQLDVILKFLPKQRQTSLFSATLSPKVHQLAQKYLHQPVRVSVGAESMPPSAITQKSIQTTHDKKNDVLLDELNARRGSAIVFTRTKHRTDKVAKYLASYGFAVSRIHGGRSQGQRNMALKGFRDGEFRILVATDIAARGIDVPQIAHVINYDLPMCDEDYLHRIGRTARAGQSGEALSLLTPEDKSAWFHLAKKYKIPGVDLSQASSHAGGSRHQGRPQKKRHFGKRRFSR